MKEHTNGLQISCFIVAIHEIPLADASVTYYVSGCIARSIVRLRKCSSCEDLLISSNNIPTDVDECIPINTSNL